MSIHFTHELHMYFSIRSISFYNQGHKICRKSNFNAYKYGCSDGFVEVVETDITSTLCCRHQSQSNEKTLQKWEEKKNRTSVVFSANISISLTAMLPRISALPVYPNSLFYQNQPNPKSGRVNNPE